MNAGALLDTSFLISLVSAARPNHPVAVRYYRHMIQHSVPMYLSAIVAAEFGIKQDVVDLPLSNFRILNFSLPHGQAAAKLWNALGARDEGDPRPVVRDDMKLIAQASHEAIPVLLTEDGSSLYRYCERLRNSGLVATRAVTLREGFDPSVFREDGQADWVEDGQERSDP